MIAWVTPVVQSIALALLVLVAGWLTIRWITHRLAASMERLALDATLKPFLVSVVNALLKILLVVTIIRILGVDTTSFAAVIAAAGFAIGLAFQGSLSNFAGGVLLLTLRPFKVGDYVEAGGHSGTVQSIQILFTDLVTPDNKVIYIPNGTLANSSIVNYSVMENRRVDFKFGVGYESDGDQVAAVLRGIVEAHPLVLENPEPFVRMSEHGDSAVFFTVRAWTKASDYWTVHFDLMETVKRRFDEERIPIPYPQMDVHVRQK
ncbi:mechanosensitive ion channel [Clostridiales bacterium F-3ap]|uniref:Mechanosensitive ion channel n=2 Tax=Anaerotalea alkaliphila TaxID=2662126 RepID=A0A7X5KM67_9FIRM|nr:mechanosensitive ion channel [Anaerotalea alkaliphila]